MLIFGALELKVEKWLNELCEELSERLHSDLEKNKRIAHTLTIHASAYKVSCLFSREFNHIGNYCFLCIAK